MSFPLVCQTFKNLKYVKADKTMCNTTDNFTAYHPCVNATYTKVFILYLFMYNWMVIFTYVSEVPATPSGVNKTTCSGPPAPRCTPLGLSLQTPITGLSLFLGWTLATGGAAQYGMGPLGHHPVSPMPIFIVPSFNLLIQFVRKKFCIHPTSGSL